MRGWTADAVERGEVEVEKVLTGIDLAKAQAGFAGPVQSPQSQRLYGNALTDIGWPGRAREGDGKRSRFTQICFAVAFTTVLRKLMASISANKTADSVGHRR